MNVCNQYILSINEIYTTVQQFGESVFFFLQIFKNVFVKNVFKINILCLSRMHLFGKNSNIWNIITILNNSFLFKYILKCNLFLSCKAAFSAFF